jgi:hypothetical protein
MTLRQFIDEYLDAAGLRGAAKSPFRLGDRQGGRSLSPRHAAAATRRTAAVVEGIGTGGGAGGVVNSGASD